MPLFTEKEVRDRARREYPVFITREQLREYVRTEQTVRDILQQAYDNGEIGYPAKDFKLKHVRDSVWKATCPEGREFVVNPIDHSIVEAAMEKPGTKEGKLTKIASKLLEKNEIELAREVLALDSHPEIVDPHMEVNKGRVDTVADRIIDFIEETLGESFGHTHLTTGEHEQIYERLVQYLETQKKAM